MRDFGDLPRVVCHPNRLNQVFMNLVHNAAQAMPEGGSLTIRTRTEGGPGPHPGVGLRPRHRARRRWQDLRAGVHDQGRTHRDGAGPRDRAPDRALSTAARYRSRASWGRGRRSTCFCHFGTPGNPQKRRFRMPLHDSSHARLARGVGRGRRLALLGALAAGPAAADGRTRSVGRHAPRAGRQRPHSRGGSREHPARGTIPSDDRRAVTGFGG